jgi:membrane fusion protein (multidrug efflux system)
VTVATAVSGTIAADTGGLGTVQASVDVPIALSFGDQVASVDVALGQQVKKGQPLLKLDPQPLVANLSHIQSHLLHAEADVTRVQGDLAHGQVSAALVPGMQDQLQKLQSQVNLFSQLLAEAQGKSSTMTSPIDGEVLAINVQAGQVAKPGTTLVEIVDYHRISVTAELPVSSQPYVRPGDQAQLTFAAIPGVVINGTVTGVSPGSVNFGTGFRLTVDAANSTSQLIHPGYQAYVRVTYQSSGATIVRRMAVLNMGLNPSMFVVNGDVVQLRQVQVGTMDGPGVQIVSGIQPGDSYVLAGSENLASGDHVRITSNLGPVGGTSG